MNRINCFVILCAFTFLAACSQAPTRMGDTDTPRIAAEKKAEPGNDLGDALVPGKPNIILMYGFLQMPSSMLAMKANMEKSGWNVIIPDLGWNVQSTDTTSELLIDFLKKQDAHLSDRYGIHLRDMQDDIVLFGHSRGGLVIVNAQRMDKSLLPLHVVTAGSAFGGIPLGAFLAPLSGAARDTLPGSEFLRELREDMKTHPRDLLQVTATFDELVPVSMNVVEGYPHYIAPFSGHLALGRMINPNVLATRLPKHFSPTNVSLVK